MFKLDYQNKVLPINVLEKLDYYSVSNQNNAALVNTRETDPKLMNAVWCESHMVSKNNQIFNILMQLFVEM